MAFPNLPESVWNINTTSLTRVAANTSAPATPFDLTLAVDTPMNIQSLAVNTSDLGALYVFEPNAGLYKDTIYDYTRSSTLSPTLLNCKRLVGAEINIGDKIVSLWGLYHILSLVSHLTFLNSRFMKPPVVYGADASLPVSECMYNLIIGDTSTAFGAVELELPSALEVSGYDGLIIEFKCNGPDTLTVVPFSATIDGAANYVLLDDESLRMLYNATDNNFEVI